MNEFRVSNLVEAMTALADNQAYADAQCLAGKGDVLIQEHLFMQFPLIVNLDECKRCCDFLDLRKAEDRLCEIRSYMRNNMMTFDRLRAELRELRKDVDYELIDRRFAYVPPKGAVMLTSMARDWHLAWEAIPSSAKDAMDAIDCYALGLYTASVFHMTRVAEIGLRELAKSLDVVLIDRGKEITIEFGDWRKVIDHLRKQIERMHRLTRNLENEEELHFYSDAADSCGYMKDMWRNPVSHARKTYNEGEALGVIERVRGFMLTVVAGLKRRQ